MSATNETNPSETFVIDAHGRALCLACARAMKAPVPWVGLDAAQADALRAMDRKRGGFGHACGKCADNVASVIGD